MPQASQFQNLYARKNKAAHEEENSRVNIFAAKFDIEKMNLQHYTSICCTYTIDSVQLNKLVHLLIFIMDKIIKLELNMFISFTILLSQRLIREKS
ncbi:hypothetical protein ECANGB1_1368 [Enterospora canceri]|uniref:Uncharacterized protein n=1 Tax=Enterospora canceri TaxID=1081671 RepID=A0A1Y1S7D4_9MICR|nr:hypothetical protein ECANGB1_1368 [Enterospora canceri]